MQAAHLLRRVWSRARLHRDAPLSALFPGAFAVAACRADPEVYADPRLAPRRREAWAILSEAFAARREHLHARDPRLRYERPGACLPELDRAGPPQDAVMRAPES